MSTNAERETWWIDAWNDLYDIVGTRSNARCKLPDGAIVGVEDCKGWLQDQAYAGWKVGVKAGSKDDGVPVVVSRWRPTDEEP
jgi:hypothetical protein